MTYEEWMKKVDQELTHLCGFTSNDLPDWSSWNAWDDGMTVKEAAQEILIWAKTF